MSSTFEAHKNPKAIEEIISSHDTGNQVDRLIDIDLSTLAGHYRDDMHELIVILSSGHVIYADESVKIRKLSTKVAWKALELIHVDSTGILWMDPSNSRFVRWHADNAVRFGLHDGTKAPTATAGSTEDSPSVVNSSGKGAAKSSRVSPKRRHSVQMADYISCSSGDDMPATNIPPTFGHSPHHYPLFTPRDKNIKSDVADASLKTVANLKDLKNAEFNNLTNIHFLPNHLSRIERICRDMNAFVGSEPLPQLRMQLITKVIKTFGTKFSNVVDYCERLTSGQDGDSWVRFKRCLLENYCSPEKMAIAYSNRLRSLKFDDVNNYEDFLSECSILLALKAQVYPNDASERRMVVKECLSKIPVEYRTVILYNLEACTDSPLGWEQLPFEDDQSRLTISNIIRRVLHAAVASQGLNQNRPASSSSLGTTDRARFTRESPTAKPTSTHQTMQEWARKFKYPTMLKGNRLRNKNSDVLPRLEKIGVSRDNVRFRKNAKEEVYAVVGMTTPDAVKVLTEALGASGKVDDLICQTYDPDFKFTKKIVESKN